MKNRERISAINSNNMVHTDSLFSSGTKIEVPGEHLKKFTESRRTQHVSQNTCTGVTAN